MCDRIIIILDLDETLIHSTFDELDRPAEFIFQDYHVYVRPHLDNFIQKCDALFNIAIWSSAGEIYVNSILRKIMPPSIKLRFVWTRPAFIDNSANTLETLRAPKNLQRLIINKLNPSNVLIIDDNPDDSVVEFGNVLQIQPYRGQPEDYELLLLSVYLEKISYVKDTRDMTISLWRELALKAVNNETF